MKASRYLTHIRRLRDPDEPAKRLISRAARLGAKLGPVLLQLPPTMHLDLDRLQAALETFRDDVRLAVELLHASWFTDGVRELLTRRGAALCLADRGSQPITPEWRTADWGYIRFHWGMAAPESCYEPEVLAAWARRLARLWTAEHNLFVYFNNDPHACALRDAYQFAVAAQAAGLRPTRVPSPAEVVID